MKKGVWLTFDLGINGDYEGMYAWLADHEAIECGDSVGFVQYESKGRLLDEIKADLQQNVELNRKSRVYAIYKTDDGKLKGSFLFGRRKQAPWTGFGAAKDEETVDEL